MRLSPVHPRAGGERTASASKLQPTDGSSPRGRGTPGTISKTIWQTRFIPARAGNAAGARPAARGPMVHPRAGGERHLPANHQMGNPGSSPRGRGTPRPSPTRRTRGRFIPARAGNAATPRTTSRRCTVHPRAGGERRRRGRELILPGGSSPRGRGTHLDGTLERAPQRFIPARAGNAQAMAWSSSMSAVHPRAGGERRGPSGIRFAGPGSSPRGRGTQRDRARDDRKRRFIPARAGNALASVGAGSQDPVHPRAGGERPNIVMQWSRDAGSSPRGRGTRSVARRVSRRDRFIPARAGNAPPPAACRRRGSVHPRAGGERPWSMRRTAS